MTKILFAVHTVCRIRFNMLMPVPEMKYIENPNTHVLM